MSVVYRNSRLMWKWGGYFFLLLLSSIIATTNKSKVSNSIIVIQLTPVSEGKLNRLPYIQYPFLYYITYSV